jgi:cell division protein FtsQ
MRFDSKNPTRKNTRVENTSQAFSSRSEEVRSRRAQRSKERISSVSTRITNPPPSRPVVVRGNAFGKPIHQQAGTRARRQFYVTMDRAAGTEVRLPAIPQVQLGWRLISFILAAAMIVGIYSMLYSPFCLIETVEVNNIQRISADEISAALGLEYLSTVEIDPAQIAEKLLAAYPELINVRVSVEMPNVVKVSAEERIPVLALANGDNTSWVDASGIIFPARGEPVVNGEPQSLVTIRADDGLPMVPVKWDTSTLIDEEENKTAQGSSSPADNAEDKTIQLMVDPTVLTALQDFSQQLPPEIQIVYSKQDGLGWQAPEGWQVFIGKNLQNFEAKYAMYQHVASYLANQGLQPALVDVAHLNAPSYRLEQ